MAAKASKKPTLSAAVPATVAKPIQKPLGKTESINIDPESKQSRVVTMLQASNGATIAAITKATGWQQHSVRGFLAAVVRKRLKLKLTSEKEDGVRTYKIADAATETASRRFKAKARSR